MSICTKEYYGQSINITLFRKLVQTQFATANAEDMDSLNTVLEHTVNVGKKHYMKFDMKNLANAWSKVYKLEKKENGSEQEQETISAEISDELLLQSASANKRGKKISWQQVKRALNTELTVEHLRDRVRRLKRKRGEDAF